MFVRVFCIALITLLAACADAPVTPPDPAQTPVRFLLTFDDGPSLAEKIYSTRDILDTLRDNPIQPGIKALFFVQPRVPGAGASAEGQGLLQRSFAEGHLLGLHSGSSEGHLNHCSMSDADLRASLVDGNNAIAAITGKAPLLIRPPYWDYNQRTLAAYADNGLTMLLTDISANDGKIKGFIASFSRRGHMRDGLRQVRADIAAGVLPSDNGVIPVVVTFHDTNSYTAQHMPEYLSILVEEAAAVGLRVSEQPFYADRSELEQAALLRANDISHRAKMVPGYWSWLWHSEQ